MTLGVAHPLPDAIPLILCYRRQDGEHQFADAIAGDVATEIDHMQADPVILELLKRAQGVRGGPEGARSSLAVITTSPGCNVASKRWPSRRSASGTEADTPASTKNSAMAQPFIMS
jgi:hypothetical protein